MAAMFMGCLCGGVTPFFVMWPVLGITDGSAAHITFGAYEDREFELRITSLKAGFQCFSAISIAFCCNENTLVEVKV